MSAITNINIKTSDGSEENYSVEIEVPAGENHLLLKKDDHETWRLERMEEPRSMPESVRLRNARLTLAEAMREFEAALIAYTEAELAAAERKPT